MAYQNDYVLRMIEQMGAALRLAAQCFAEGGSGDEVLEATNSAISMAVDMPAEMFLRMSPQSMVSLLEISSADDRMIRQIADALLLQADVLEVQGLLVEADVRREQATAVLRFIDPALAN